VIEDELSISKMMEEKK
jgi:ATP-dependent RNA helicase DOB1